jgi:uncharacterized protein
MNPSYTVIYETVVGSTAYGTNIATSDIDIKAIAIPNIRHVLGMHPFDQHLTSKDHTIYSLRKFFSLAQDCNPNIIEMLYTDESNIRYMDKYGKMLRDNRELFISKKAKYTFSGYAFAQLQRIKNHKKWINNPQTLPVRHDFFSDTEYDTAFKKYRQYEDWKKERNPERAELEAKCGFDSKHGMHLIRLARMGKEILTTGKVIVKRNDVESLLNIRNGNISYDDIVKEAEETLNELEFLYDISSLPKSPDMNKIENLLLEIQRDFYGILVDMVK